MQLRLIFSTALSMVAIALPVSAQSVQVAVEPEPEKIQIQCGHKDGVEICIIRQTRKGKRITTVVKTPMPGYPDRQFCDLADSRCPTAATQTRFQSYSLVPEVEQATRCSNIDTERNCRVAGILGLQIPAPRRIDRKN